MKPRIRKDQWAVKGFICRSYEPSNWREDLKRPIIGSGDTVEEAYRNWEEKHRAWVIAPLIDTRFLYPKESKESAYRNTLGPLAALLRSITHRRDGAKR